MYHINQFKPTLYVLLVLGITGFALASESPGVWIIGAGGVTLNAWLVASRRFRPLPRIVANLVTLAAMLFVARQLAELNSSAVLIIGQFLVVLQLVKLWEQRQNRDYAQLLVLSLLLMVAASISTTNNSLLFGILLAVYLFNSLYCCLLFHLKVETDKARLMYARQVDPAGVGGPAAAAAGDDEGSGRPAENPAALRQGQRHLGRSMRRLSAVVSAGAIGTAVVVFLAFPRGPAQGMFTPPQMRVGQAMTGFSDTVSFDQVARIQQNDRVVAYADVRKNGRRLGPGDTIYLRGVTLDRYSSPAMDPGGDAGRGRGRGIGFRREPRGDFNAFVPSPDVDAPAGPPASSRPHRPGWGGPPGMMGYAERMLNGVGGGTGSATMPAPPAIAPRPAVDAYAQTIDLQPTGTKVLFVVSGTAADGQFVSTARTIHPVREVDVMQGADRSVQTQEVLGGPVRYDVAASDAVDAAAAAEFRPSPARPVPFDANGDDVEDPLTKARVPGVKPLGRVPFPSYLRSFGVSDRDTIIEVDGQPLSALPRSARVDRVVEAYVRQGRPVTVVRGGPNGNRRLTFPYVPPEIDAYARRPDVSGRDDAGRPLAEQREQLAGPGPLDEQIARNIAQHFQTKYTYTLDVTDARTRADQDPILWFISDQGHKGHCEYFAGAMALLCQDLGLTARVAVGFKCDNYNTFKEQFEVTQAHAHAWVEVLTPEGWRTFDPTSGRGADSASGGYGLWQQAKHFFNWLEFAYASNVIAYDNDSRENLIQAVEARMTKPLYQGVNDGWLTRRLYDFKLFRLLADNESAPVRWATVAVAVGGAWLGGWWALRRWRLRRRAARIGLDALPDADRLRLARQLGFYDDLIRLLARRQIVRPAHQTPLEFARSLLFLPAGTYETVRRLTEVFYGVRYGGRELSTGLQHRLGRTIARVDAELGPAAVGGRR